MEINRVYYAYCFKEKKKPEWIEARSKDKLPEKARELFLDYVKTVNDKKIGTSKTRIHELGGEIVEIDDSDPNLRKIPLATILPEMVELDVTSEAEKFGRYAQVIAKKYLATRWIRNRIIFVIHLDNAQPFIAIIATDLSEEEIRHIDSSSHDIKFEVIQDYLPELKKGGIFPAYVNGERKLDRIKIFQSNYAAYFPNALECRAELTTKEQFLVLSSTLNKACQVKGVKLTYNQHKNFMERLRKRTGDVVTHETIEEEMRKISGLEDIDFGDTLDKVKDVPKSLVEKFKEKKSISRNTISKTDIEIAMEDAKITFPNRYVIEEKVFRFERGGYHYIVVKGINPEIKGNVVSITWEDFKRKIEG